MGRRDRIRQQQKAAAGNQAQLVAALAIHIMQQGGSIEIPHLSEFAGRTFSFQVVRDADADTLTIAVTEDEPTSKPTS